MLYNTRTSLLGAMTFSAEICVCLPLPFRRACCVSEGHNVNNIGICAAACADAELTGAGEWLSGEVHGCYSYRP